VASDVFRTLRLGEVGEVAADHEFLFGMDALIIYFVIMVSRANTQHGNESQL
jgi:hypothetical protein